MTLKICFVDRFIIHSTKMFESLQEIISQNDDYQISFLGPNDNNQLLFSDQFVKNSKKIWSSGNYILRIYKYLRSMHPNVVHFIFESRTYGPFLSSLKFPILLFLVRLSKIKIAITLHSVLFYRVGTKWEIPYYLPSKIPTSILKPFVRLFYRIICTLSNKIIVGTDESKSCLTQYYGINEDKIEVIRFGILPVEKIIDKKIEEKYRKLFQNKKIILYFGVISPRKNQDLVIRSFKSISEKIPEYIMIIAGKATEEFSFYEKEIRLLSTNLKLDDRIFFTGFIDNEEASVLFDMADMILYIYHPMPDPASAFTFAIQHAKPTIVSNIAIFREILSEKSTLFVEPEDEIQLANAIFQLATNKELRSQFEYEMQLLSRKFTLQEEAKKHLEIYQKLSQ